LTNEYKGDGVYSGDWGELWIMNGEAVYYKPYIPLMISGERPKPIKGIPKDLIENFKKLEGFEIKDTEVCECECHVKGEKVLHVAPCCPVTYRTYISKDGVVDFTKWGKFVREVRVGRK